MKRKDYIDLLFAVLGAIAITLPFWGTALCSVICEDVNCQSELDQPITSNKTNGL